MKFTIVENIRNHDEWDTVKGFLTGFLKVIILLILIPFLLIGWLVNLSKTDKEKEVINEWTEFYSSSNLKLERVFINESELPDNLDYPKESNDIYLFKVKSNPELPELYHKYFDYQFVERDEGVYLLSFNRKNEGMSIWFIDNKKPRLEKIKDLDSGWWNFGNRNGIVTLETTLDRKDIRIEIK